MRAVIQRVERASVTIAGDVVGKIGAGYLILLGVGHADTRAAADTLGGPIFALRIYDDEEGKTNLSLPDVDGEVLVVSQFTLFANCRKGRRPSFVEAAPPAQKIFALRINDDEEGKTNLSLPDVDGEVLVVSQFTLFANCRKGRRPSFVEAAPPAQATDLYEYFVDIFRDDVGRVQTGRFGADMQVELVNDGPFTIVLDTDEL